MNCILCGNVVEEKSLVDNICIYCQGEEAARNGKAVEDHGYDKDSHEEGVFDDGWYEYTNNKDLYE